MSKGIQQVYTSGRFLLIFGLVMIMTTGLVRPDPDDESDESATSSEEDRGIEFYLNALRDMQQQQEEQQQLDSPLFDVKKREENPSFAVTSRSGSPAAVLYRRSALNKNFIRFGRSGFKPRQTQSTQPTKYRMMTENDSPDSTEERSPAGRSSRSLNSNFIRFGRSFFPSNRWAETTRRFARAGRRMNIVDSGSSRLMDRSADKLSASI